MFLKYNPMNQTKSKGASMCAKKKNNKSNKKKKKKSMLCYAICLSIGSPKAPLPQLMAQS